MMAVVFLLLPALQTGASDIEPVVVAKFDRQLWPEPINSIAGFNTASRAFLLAFVFALQETLQTIAASDADSPTPLETTILDRGSVRKWLTRERTQLLRNYQIASRHCMANDWTCAAIVRTYEDLVSKSQALPSTMPSKLQPWWKDMRNLSRGYVSEQLRLAALFPTVSSEIDRFNDNEWNGDALPDRQFFLTFDDGPSPVHGTTDEVLTMLETEKKSAVFFVIGINFQDRLNKTGSAAIAELYRNNCVASHGWEHQSHAMWDQWQESIARTQALVSATIVASNTLPLFRPPYGQRRADIRAFFRAQSLQVALWNLDSQDWNTQVDSKDIVNRMIALMLIKRHGVMLFHDVQPKASVALPLIFKDLGGAVEWGDCHRLAKPAPTIQ